LGKGVALERGEQGRGNQARGDGTVWGNCDAGGNSGVVELLAGLASWASSWGREAILFLLPFPTNS